VKTYDKILKQLIKQNIRPPDCWTTYLRERHAFLFHQEGEILLACIKNIFSSLNREQIAIAVSHSPLIQAAVQCFSQEQLKLKNIAPCSLIEFSGEREIEKCQPVYPID